MPGSLSSLFLLITTDGSPVFPSNTEPELDAQQIFDELIIKYYYPDLSK